MNRPLTSTEIETVIKKLPTKKEKKEKKEKNHEKKLTIIRGM